MQTIGCKILNMRSWRCEILKVCEVQWLQNSVFLNFFVLNETECFLKKTTFFFNATGGCLRLILFVCVGSFLG